MAGGKLTLMQDGTYGFSLQASDSGLTENVNVQVRKFIATFSNSSNYPDSGTSGFALSGTTEGKSYTLLAVKPGVWATPITDASSNGNNPQSASDGSASIYMNSTATYYIPVTRAIRVKQGGSWKPLDLEVVNLVHGDTLIVYALEI